MTIYFATPPLAQQEGGLQAALEAMRAALMEGGAEVVEGLPPEGPCAGSVVHFHGLWQPAFAQHAAELRHRGVPYVVSPHGMLEPWAWRHKWWKKWPYYYAVERRFLAGASALMATAASEARVLQSRLPRQRVEILPLGLTGRAGPDYTAARAELGWTADERVLLYLSRLHPKKGLHHLLAALAAMPAPGLRRLAIVGDGDAAYLTRLKALAPAAEQAGWRINWVGAVWDEARWPYFQGADLFCLPTHSENFGLAVLEALQVGTPVLTTQDTPWRETLRPPQGYICEPSPAAVRQALQQWEQAAWAAEDRQSLAEAIATQYSWPSLTPRYLACYKRLGEV